MTLCARDVLTTLLWRALALISIALGLIGIFLPVLPTVPFLLLAAWAAQRGWPALDDWLVRHPRYGPHIRGWRKQGAVPRRAKWAATLMMTISAAIMIVVTSTPVWAKVGVPLFFVVIAVWLWRRPEPAPAE